MLNRLYIAVGIVIILILSGAFIAPLLIDWEQYRGRLEKIAAQGFGASVTIRGSTEFRLLPQPRMVFHDVVIGPLDKPLASARRIQADFDLMSFLSDRFEMSNLLLDEPRVSANISAQGDVSLSFDLPERAKDKVFKVENLTINDGRIIVYDARRATPVQLTRVEGKGQIGNLYGPYGFSGRASYEGQPYAVRFNVSEMGSSGGMNISLFIQPEHGQYSLNSSGTIAYRDGQPVYGGAARWQTHNSVENDQDANGVRVVETLVELSAKRLVLPELVFVPDDQRPATRLTGSAFVEFGETPTFDLKLSGGLVAMAPRDIRTRDTVETPALIRALENLPPLPSPVMDGRVSLELAEFDMGAVSVRDLRLLATTKNGDWRVQELVGSLPGQTAFLLRGTVGNVGGHLSFAGRLDGESSHIDGLARLWRNQVSAPELVGARVSLSSDLIFGSGGVSLSKATLFLEQSSVDFDLAMRLGGAGSFSLDVRAGVLEQSDGRVLAALMRDNGDLGGYRAKLDRGDVKISIGRARVDDLTIVGFNVLGGWNGAGPYLTALRAEDIAGLSVDLAGDLLIEPNRLVGEFVGTVAGAAQVDLALIAQTLKIDRFSPETLAKINQVTPFAGKVEIGTNSAADTPYFVFGMEGTAAGAEIDLSGEFAGDMTDLAGGEGKLFLLARHGDVAVLQAMFGLGELVEGGDQGLFDFQLEGKLEAGARLAVRLEGTQDHAKIAGILTKQRGQYTLSEARYDLELTNGAPLLELAGANDLPPFPLQAQGAMALDDQQMLELKNLNVTIGGQKIFGELALPFGREKGRISGQLRIEEIELEQIVHSVAGASALLVGPGIWPVGPLAIGTRAFGHRGQVHIETEVLGLSLSRVIDQASFDIGWTENSLTIDNFNGAYGGGTVALKIELCCTGASAEIGLTGRVSGRSIALKDLSPDELNDTISGRLNFDSKIESAGPSVDDLIRRLGGEGVFWIDDLSIAKLSPTVFAKASAIENVADVSESELEQLVVGFVEEGPFVSARTEGILAASNGKIRVRNLAIVNGTTRLFGDARLDLADFSVEGNWALSNRAEFGAVLEAGTGSEIVAPAGGLVGEARAVLSATAQVNATFSGPMDALDHGLDVSALTDALRVRALAIEIDRLEKLRAEQEAREAERRKIEAERARVAQELAQKLAQELARIKAEEDAKKQAEIDAAQALAEAAAQKAADDAAVAAVRQAIIDAGVAKEQARVAQEKAKAVALAAEQKALRGSLGQPSPLTLTVPSPLLDDFSEPDDGIGGLDNLQ